MADNEMAINTAEADAVEEKPKRRGRKPKAAAIDAASVKEEATKKTPVKKVEPKTTVVIEYADKKVTTKDIIAAATKAFKKANRGVVIKKIEVYVKPEENVAYYAVNGVGSADYKIEL